MRRVVVPALTVLLILLGSPSALGDSRAEERGPASFALFGFELCLPDAEESEACPLRLADPGERVAAALTSLPDPSAAARGMSDTVLPLFGARICLGEVSPDAECDLRVPPLLPDLDAPMMRAPQS